MENVVFEASSWEGTSDGRSVNNQYITSDKEYFVNDNKIKTLTDDEYDKVVKFIQEKMIGHSYKSRFIYDYGCSVKATIDGNEMFFSNVEPLYQDALLLFKEISGQRITAKDISKLKNEYMRYNYYNKKNELVEKSIFYIEKRYVGLNYTESLKIVTNDKELYKSSISWGIFKKFPNYDIKFIRTLSDDEYKKIIEYIENNIIGKQYEYEKINNSTSYAVYAKYNNNRYDNFNNLELYKDSDKLLS